MRSLKRLLTVAALPVAAGLVWFGTAPAASHLWRFNEVFSNADGTVQFIEMHECCGATSEHELNAKWIEAVHSGNRYTFRKSLTGNTADKYFLLATQGFADLPGMPAPDFIIPNGFLPVDGDTLEYWLYGDATWSYTAGQLPLDGVNSLGADGAAGPATPTNYAGETVPVRPLTWGMLKFRIR